ncbi:hypothetical protein OK7_05289, partial [Enterococcus faecium EnGen0024]|uniref:hypothetical protein n=1 Tax=Enterococcus faecium TaxID=1352 RepID=UPI0002A2E976
CHEFKKTSHMAMESKKAYGFLFKISTKTNKKELAIKPLLFVYSLRAAITAPFIFLKYWHQLRYKTHFLHYLQFNL